MRQQRRRKPNKSRRRNIYYYIYISIYSAEPNFGRTGVIVHRELKGALCYHRCFDKIHIYHRPNNMCVCLRVLYMVRVFISPSRCSHDSCYVISPRSFSDTYLYFSPLLAVFVATGHKQNSYSHGYAGACFSKLIIICNVCYIHLYSQFT